MRQWVAAQGGLEPKGEGQQRAQRVADRLAKGRSELSARVSVLASDAVSAFSWPNGQVFVTRGLLERLDDDELAAAIAHELGHLLDDRHVRPTFSLRGCASGLDLEARADALGANLLEMQGLRRDSMTSMLRKVASSPRLPATCREALSRRIELLNRQDQSASARAANPQN